MKPKHLVAPLTTLLMLYIVLLASTLPMVCLGVNMADSDFLKYEVREVFVGELKHTIQIINQWQSATTGGKLIVPLVKNQTSRHYAILYNFSARGGQFNGPVFLNDSFGNMYICWEGIEIPPTTNFTVELSYFVLSFSVKYPVNSSLVNDYNRGSELYRLYTQPEELIQSDNPEIVETARNVIGEEKNPYKIALLIYNFVTKHLKYEIQDKERGALWALKNGMGDCSEYSYLFVALCRAAGIPARAQVGFAFHYADAVIEDGHMWAEYYLENYGWIPVDATWKMFSHMDYRHISSIQSMPEVIPYANYFFNTSGGKQPKDKQAIQFRRESTSRFSDSQFTEKIAAAAKNARQAEFGVFLGKILGTKILFPSEVEDVERKILENKICIQNAVDSWEQNLTIATYNAARASEGAEDTLKDAWMLIAKVFTLYIAIALVLVIASLTLSKHSSQRPAEA